MAAAERRSEIATLRAVGGRRRRLLRAFLAEAAVLGLAGSIVGVALGSAVARALVEHLPASLVATVGVAIRFRLPTQAVPAGIALGVAAAVLAAYLPARRVAQVPPVEAMRPEGVAPAEEPRWDRVSAPILIGGVGATALSSALAFRADEPAVLFTAVGAGLVGLVAVARATAPLLLAATARLAASLGAPGRLAATSIAGSRQRVWATTAAVFLAMGMVVGQGAMIGNVSDSATRRWAALAAVDFVVQPSPPETLPTDIRMPAAWEGPLSTIDGVASVRAAQFVYVTIGSSRVLVDGVAPHGRAPELAAVSPPDRALVLSGEAAVVTEPLAQRLSLEEGDQVTVPSPVGPRSLTIVEVIDLPLWLEGAIVVALPVMREWFGRDGASRFEIDVAPRKSPARVKKALERFVGGAPFPVWVFTGRENLAGIRKSVDDASAALIAMQWVVVFTAAVSVLNTLILSVLERRRELGILRAMGANRRLLAGMVIAEAVAIAAVGAAVGVAIGLYFQSIGVTVIGRARGLPADFAFTPAHIGLTALAVSALCVVGSLGPARRAARLNVIEAIGYE
jgi:putative ABC transport system permease protein